MSVETVEAPFVAGGKYENRKGLFEVLEIKGNTMQIRWDTGEQVVTTIDLQSKILRNLEREVAAAATGTAKKGYRTPKSYGELFRGLQPGDFTEDVTGTHWRSREQLGGVVTSLLRVDEPFDSWSVYKRPEIHWASVSRYRLVSPWLQTKYVVRIDEKELLFGLYIERSDNTNDNRDDWLRFLAWAENVDNCLWLHQVLRSTEAAMRNPYGTHDNHALQGVITAESDGCFRYHGAKGMEFEAAALPQFLESLPDNRWVNLVISRMMARDEAISQGVGISNVIADFFNLLLPVYHGTPATNAAPLSRTNR